MSVDEIETDLRKRKKTTVNNGNNNKPSAINRLIRSSDDDNIYNDNKGSFGLPGTPKDKMKAAAPYLRRIRIEWNIWYPKMMRFLVTDVIYKFVVWFIRIFLWRWNGPKIGEDPCPHQLERKWELIWYALPEYGRGVIFALILLLLYFILMRSGIEKGIINIIQENEFYSKEYLEETTGLLIYNKYNPKFLPSPTAIYSPMETERLIIVTNGTKYYPKITQKELELGYKEIFMRGKIYNISIFEVIKLLKHSQYSCVGAANFGVPLNIVLYGHDHLLEHRNLVMDYDIIEAGRNRIKTTVTGNLGEKSIISPEQMRISYTTESGHILKETVHGNNATCLTFYWELANKISLEKYLENSHSNQSPQ